MTGRYAADTEVSTEKSRMEIERVLMKYGAREFAYASSDERAMVAFAMEGRKVRFLLPLPDREDYRYTTGKHLERSPHKSPAKRVLWGEEEQGNGVELFAFSGKRNKVDFATTREQGCRQRWRALLLVVKAKLEAVECGIATFDDEFMAHILIPGGGTVGDWMGPQIVRAYELGEAPSILPMLEGKEGRHA